MAIRITKNSIHATGADANALFISFTPNDQLTKQYEDKTGSPEFQAEVKRQMIERGLIPNPEQAPPPPEAA